VHSEVKEKYNNKSRIITNQERNQIRQEMHKISQERRQIGQEKNQISQERNQRINQKINTERLPSRKRGLAPARARKRVTNWNISLVGDPRNLFENLWGRKAF